MKSILYTFLLFSIGSLFSCQDESDGMGEKGVGYLTLNVGTSSATNTRAAEYNPKQIAVQIVNLETEAVVEETDDWETWKGEKFVLETGKYAVVASSAGFDGSSPEFEKPYYTGADTVNIEPNISSKAEITCTLANVKLTVDFSFFRDNGFKAASVEVGTGGSSLTFSMDMDTEEKAGYFPVKPLTANLTVTNKNGAVHTLKTLIEDAEARDHIILKYKSGEAEQGESGIMVTVDESTKTYTYIIPVEMKEIAAGLDATSVNAWSKFAYMEGTATVKGMELDNSLVKMQYKTLDAPDWTSLDAEWDGSIYKATATKLDPKTNYQYRMYYKSEDTEYVSDTITFTTEEQMPVDNLNLDTWCTIDKSQYACSEKNFDHKFWDSGNEGANTLKSLNPTKEETSDVVKGSAARLTSTEVNAVLFKVFAAGSLYSGDFLEAVVGGMSADKNGAKLSFGQPYTSRPTQLTGYYKYNPENVNYTSSKVPNVKSGQRDSCSIYIALTDWSAPFEVNTQTSTFVDFNSSNIIAYGELSKEEMSPESMTNYKEFTIDLVYRDLVRKPTHILIVCSSSKYGDYFVGGVGSCLLVDELQLLYDKEPVAKK